MRYGKLWLCLILVIVGAFSTLGYFGREIFRQMPPIPKRVVTTDGRTLFTGETILDGQVVWQSIGGQELGSIWGHGSYTAPDWSADWLHRQAVWILEHWAEADFGTAYGKLDAEAQAALRARLQELLRTNGYDPKTGDLAVAPVVAQAFEAVGEHYTALFGDNPALDKLRAAYALPPNALRDSERQGALNCFFFWTAWACAANRPGTSASYTQNWPPETLVGNHPTGELMIWSLAGFALLLAGIGALGLYYAILHRRPRAEAAGDLPERDPLLGLRPSPSMKATGKYFWAIAAMLVLQVALGAITAHYGMAGAGLYGFPLAKWLPYSLSRTWHLQLAIFWIATAWMGSGLFMAPAVAGHEPRGQRLGVNLLFACLILVAAASMTGQWYAIRQRLGLHDNFWVGHSGMEYLDLGRAWQLVMMVALVLWLVLMLRALRPAFAKIHDSRHLLALILFTAAAIVLFYGAGLMWDQRTNLAKIEFWRWWAVHQWVEGFFEVFATVVTAFLFTRMGLLATQTATSAVLFTTTVFLAGGIIGTFHHLYFSGTPVSVLALGSVFSGLEVVPLALIGFEGYRNLTLGRARPWARAYQWPIRCFAAVAFWNLIGAGLCGFLINTPIALYYMQGLYTTPVHVHTSLFGVYGMMGIGLLLFCLKGLSPKRVWKTGALSFAFWAINLGLALTMLLSLLPVGLLQTWASVEYGMWLARGAEFMQSELVRSLRWMRVVGDVTFASGVLALAWFVVGLKTGWSLGSRRELVLQKEAESEEFPVRELAKWD